MGYKRVFPEKLIFDGKSYQRERTVSSPCYQVFLPPVKTNKQIGGENFFYSAKSFFCKFIVSDVKLIIQGIIKGKGIGVEQKCEKKKNDFRLKDGRGKILT